jgi:hypothetical protein
MSYPRAGLAVLLALLGMSAGCKQIIGAVGYYFRPRQIQKPQYEFTAGTRVAMVIDAARPGDENPVFNQALHERVVEMLREGKSHATVLPLSAITDLRRANPDFDNWSVQKIGRALQADEVLYIKIDRLVIRQTPDHPVLTPTVEARMKVISASQPPVHARLWPQAKEGHPVHCARQITEAADANPEAADIEARKLGHDTAYYAAMPFIEVDLEENPPVEQ